MLQFWKLLLQNNPQWIYFIGLSALSLNWELIIAQFHNPQPIFLNPLCNPNSNSRPLFQNVQKDLFTLTKKGQKSSRLWFQNDDLNDFNHFSLANGFFPTEMSAWIVYGTLETEQMNVTSRIFIRSVDQGPLKKWTEHSNWQFFLWG